ncbi:MAG: hypothetical protein QMB63_08380 [Clostridiaceae bacterium]
MIKVKKLYSKLLDFLYEVNYCPVCKNEGKGLCRFCKKDIHRYGEHRINDIQGYTMFFYKGAAERLIYGFKKQLKFSSYYELLKLMEEEYPLITDFWEVYDGKRPDIMVYIPSIKKNISTRGFDPGLLLAEGFSGISGIELLKCTGNKSKSETKSMDHLGRKLMLESSLFIKPGYKDKLMGKSILIFDDLVTTGASIKSLASKLIEEGAGEVKFLTLLKSTK